MKSIQAEIIKQDHLVDDIYSMYIKNKELIFQGLCETSASSY